MSDDTLTMLADAAAGFAKPDLARVRKLRGTDPGFDPQRWQEMAEQGWFSILASEDDGGLGLGIDAACVVARKLGYALFPEPFVAAGVMAPLALARGDNAQLKAGALAKIMGGETIASFAWQGAAGSIAFDALGVSATASGNGVSLSGEARFVVAPSADAFVVAAKTGNGAGLYWVPADSLSITRETCADGSAQGRIKFSNVHVGTDAVIADGERGAALLCQVVDAGVLATAAELSGTMDRMVEMTLEYLRTRQQFGKFIGSFQALQHRVVDFWMQQQLSEAAITAAAAVLMDANATADAKSSAASGAKSRASDAALLIAKQSIQMHGAIGVTDEYDLGLYVNRVLTLAAWLGNGATHRRRFGELASEAND